MLRREFLSYAIIPFIRISPTQNESIVPRNPWFKTEVPYRTWHVVEDKDLKFVLWNDYIRNGYTFNNTLVPFCTKPENLFDDVNECVAAHLKIYPDRIPHVHIFHNTRIKMFGILVENLTDNEPETKRTIATG